MTCGVTDTGMSRVLSWNGLSLLFSHDELVFREVYLLYLFLPFASLLKRA